MVFTKIVEIYHTKIYHTSFFSAILFDFECGQLGVVNFFDVCEGCNKKLFFDFCFEIFEKSSNKI